MTQALRRTYKLFYAEMHCDSSELLSYRAFSCSERDSGMVPAAFSPEYKNLERIPVDDAWFEVYQPARDVFAIYDTHQAEEVISYLIVGKQRALLFDTGMGISDIKKMTAELTGLPIIVLNSHTHDDHVGGNWQFKMMHGIDTDFTRKNARGSREDAQTEIMSDQICGALPTGFDANTYAPRPWEITAYTHDGGRFRSL